jgi:hypothetical protein
MGVRSDTCVKRLNSKHQPRVPNMTDPVFGKTWNINQRQSSFAGSPTPVTETRLYESIGEGYRLTVSGSSDGMQYEWGYTAEYDGTPCAVFGRGDVDTISKHKVSDLITIGSFSKNGKVVAAYRRETTIDGKTLTVVASGQRPDGATYFDVLNYDSAPV